LCFGYAPVLVRYDLDGEFDDTFGTGGVAVQAYTNGYEDVGYGAVQRDGKILVQIAPGPGGGLGALARNNVDGSVDRSFGVGGILDAGTGTQIHVIGQQPSGDLVLLVPTFDGQRGRFVRCALARAHLDGTLDPTFGTTGFVDLPVGSGCGVIGAVQDDGAITVAYGGVGSGAYVTVARFGQDGAPDTGFGEDGQSVVPLQTNAPPYYYQLAGAAGIAVDGSGRTALAIVDTPDDYSLSVVQLDDAGRIEPAFGDGGRSTLLTFPVGDQAFSSCDVAMGDEGITLAGFYFPTSTSGGLDVMFVAHLDPDGRGLRMERIDSIWERLHTAPNDSLPLVKIEADRTVMAAFGTGGAPAELVKLLKFAAP
jgi:hypothetical protein